jgi:predicted HicB family RNase H-like nuclease
MPLITPAEAITEPRHKQFLVRLAESTRTYLEQEAKTRGISMAAIVNEALAEHALARMK